MGTVITYSAKSDAALQRALNRFATACENKAFQGTIPAYESDEAFAAYTAIDTELDASRRALEALIERRAA